MAPALGDDALHESGFHAADMPVLVNSFLQLCSWFLKRPLAFLLMTI
jgi:hypothetical protein